MSSQTPVVGWDLRGGAGASAPVRCFANASERAGFREDVPVPTTQAEERRYLPKTIALAQRCGELNGELLAHISTADTARDLDHLRRLAGDRQLTYLGESYGTLIGQTYANLFPRQVRAMALDGLIDAVAAADSAEAVLASGQADTDRVFKQFLSKFAALPDPSLWPVTAVALEAAIEGDASITVTIARGATSDQLRMLLQEQGTALVCADSPARHPAHAWPQVVDRLEDVSRIGGPVVHRIACPSTRTSASQPPERHPGPRPAGVSDGRQREGSNCRSRLPSAAVARAAALLVAKEATMEEHFVWMTTRQVQPGTLADFERAWRPDRHPEGMLRAYAYWSEDEREIVGISLWASKESCEAWRASEAEARRREAMAAYVLGEQESFYRGRELVVPAR